MRRLAVGLVVLVAALYAVLSLTLEFDADSLGRSVAGETGARAYMFGCSERSGVWACTVLDGDGGADYAVRRGEGRCWKARRLQPSDRGPAFPARAEGCVDVLELVGDALGFGPELYD